jgi:hypothetical protein
MARAHLKTRLQESAMFVYVYRRRVQPEPKRNRRAKDLTFASNLINQFNRKGTLSDKAAPWVAKLIARAKGETPAPANVGNLSGLLDLFKTAGGKLKFPKIRLQVNGKGIVLSVAGERSKAPGSINIAGDGAWTERPWYGRVSPEGVFDPARSVDAAFAEAIAALLEELSSNPLAAVQRYGRLTGCCMFCGDSLGPRNGGPDTPTTRRSLAAGFGETCAKNYGLHAEWKQAAK